MDWLTGGLAGVTWFKVDDSFHSHPKILKAGNAAVGLWVRCGSYCAEHLTDGHVSKDIVELYGTETQTSRLEVAGLWVPEDGGWAMHDYTFYNPTSARVVDQRKATAERQRRARQAARSRRD
jgi:hypothetical protein